jgi:hypothetical protein
LRFIYDLQTLPGNSPGLAFGLDQAGTEIEDFVIGKLSLDHIK